MSTFSEHHTKNIQKEGSNSGCFGRTVCININNSGDMTICFQCKKIHRAFVHPDNYYNGNVCECNFCCPVLRITLPPLKQ